MGSNIEESSDYRVLEEHIRKINDDKNRFVPIEERRDTGILGSHFLVSISRGNMIINSKFNFLLVFSPLGCWKHLVFALA